jgi:predicted secreted protein
MSWVTFIAVAFVVWWVVIFAALPFGLRTQDDQDEVTLGTVSSAPHGSHVLRAVIRATLITAAIMSAYYYLSTELGIGIDSIPRIVPELGQER